MLNKSIFLPSVFFFLAASLMLLVTDNEGFIFIAKFILFVSLTVPVAEFVLRQTIGASKAKIILANLLLLGVSVTVMLFVAEFFVRFLFDDITTTGDNTSYFALRGKAEHTPSVNSLGFREREIIKQKPVDTYRVVIVGDSLTYGQGITEDERFSSIIELKLNGTNDNYEVLNFGRPGAETIDHIRFLDDILELNPDFILLQWYINDVEGHDKSMRPRPYRLIPSDYLSGLFHRNSALYYLINRKWNALQRNLGLSSTYNQSMIMRFSDSTSDDSRRANHELNEFINRVKNNNIALGIVLFPPLIETGGNVNNYPFGFLFDRVMGACHKNAIRCVDMRPEFTNITPVSDLRVNRFDSHPSAYANKIAAETILEAFNDEWRLDRVPSQAIIRNK